MPIMTPTRVIDRRKEAERCGRIEQILQGARKVFLKKGYWSATMRDISEESQLSTGAIYFYFKGKDEIYGRICEDVMRLTVKLLKRSRKTGVSMRERLVSAIKAYVGFYTDYGEDFDVLEAAFKQVTLPEDINLSIERLVQEALSFVNEIFVQGVADGELPGDIDTWKLTMNIWAAIEGALYIHKRKFLEEAKYDLDDFIMSQINVFLGGIENMHRA
ncbi:MAG: TetR/AcrR family transcriptional regulator [Spirochaetales bacterium]|nr:MAG: TetR/AcrR family transcriptional regulator [Spirochaetales bacterium]